jgi:hypothetical protein
MSSLEAFLTPDCYAALNCEVMLMSKLTVQEFVTIDGFAAAPDGALDFMPSGGRTPADPQIERDQLRFIKDEVDTMLLGGTRYQIFIDYWPTATTDNEIIADELNALSKVLASRTLDHAPWGDRGDEATIVRDGVEAAAALRRQSGKGVVVHRSRDGVGPEFVSTGVVQFALVLPFANGGQFRNRSRSRRTPSPAPSNRSHRRLPLQAD